MVRPQFHPVALFYFILVTHPIPNQRRPGLTSGYGKRNGAIFNSIYSHSTNDIYIQQIAFTFNKSHSHSTIHIQHITFTFNKLYLYSTNCIHIQQIAFTFNKNSINPRPYARLLRAPGKWGILFERRFERVYEKSCKEVKGVPTAKLIIRAW